MKISVWCWKMEEVLYLNLVMRKKYSLLHEGGVLLTSKTCQAKEQILKDQSGHNHLKQRHFLCFPNTTKNLKSNVTLFRASHPKKPLVGLSSDQNSARKRPPGTRYHHLSMLWFNHQPCDLTGYRTFRPKSTLERPGSLGQDLLIDAHARIESNGYLVLPQRLCSFCRFQIPCC